MKKSNQRLYSIRLSAGENEIYVRRGFVSRVRVHVVCCQGYMVTWSEHVTRDKTSGSVGHHWQPSGYVSMSPAFVSSLVPCPGRATGTLRGISGTLDGSHLNNNPLSPCVPSRDRTRIRNPRWSSLLGRGTFRLPVCETIKCFLWLKADSRPRFAYILLRTLYALCHSHGRSMQYLLKKCYRCSSKCDSHLK